MFRGLRKNVENLEKEEEQALYKWKRTVQIDDPFMFERLQIDEAYKWNL